MSLKTYTGSCHCGRVRIEAKIDFAQGTGRCNCTFCTKTRQWGVIVKPDAFKLLSGADDLTDYQGQNKAGHSPFCKHCGVRPFGQGELEVLGGKYYSVNIACLDEYNPEEWTSGPMRYFDGRHNNWMEAPAFTKHM